MVVDKKNLVVTTPAFMYETPNFHEVFDGIGNMIKELLLLVKKWSYNENLYSFVILIISK